MTSGNTLGEEGGKKFKKKQGKEKQDIESDVTETCVTNRLCQDVIVQFLS